MREIKITKETFESFYNDLRKEDLQELKFFFKKNTKKQYFKELQILKNIYFLADKNNKPIAMGGAEKDSKDETIGQVWLLCTNEYQKHRLKLYKYTKEKLKEFKKEFKILYNYIFKSNFKAQIWLEKEGFTFKETENPNFKIFYYETENKN